MQLITIENPSYARTKETHCTKPFRRQSKGNTQQRKDLKKIIRHYFNYIKHICMPNFNKILLEENSFEDHCVIELCYISSYGIRIIVNYCVCTYI